MSIKNIVEYYELINEIGADEAAKKIDPEETSAIFDEMDENYELAKKVILEKISEEQFVKFLRVVKKMVTFMAAGNGEVAPAILDQLGELDGYNHTFSLSLIGALIKEEIL